MWSKTKSNFSWIIFLAIGSFFVFIGLLDVLFGVLLDPVIWEEISSLGIETKFYASLIVRVLGYAMISFGLLIITISVTSYRNYEKWAWIVLWVIPCFLLLVSLTVISQGGVVWIIEVLILIISAITQILALPNFLDKKISIRGN